jgi:hypothetical protein
MGFFSRAKRSSLLSPRKQSFPRPRTRLRRLFFERFEDRRMLATALNDHYSVAMNGTLSREATHNDSYDPDGAYAYMSSWPTNVGGFSSGSGDGQLNFWYMPRFNFVGTDSFSYVLCDAAGCDSATVTIESGTRGWKIKLRSPICEAGFRRPHALLKILTRWT